MSVADKMSQAYVQGADDAKKQARQELEELRDLVEHTATQFSNFELEELRDIVGNQARIIESMQKQINKMKGAV